MKTLKNKIQRQILDTAEVLFYSQGYTNTTINDILRTIGIAEETFYYHVHSQEEVMNAIVMRFIDNSLKAAEVIASNPDIRLQEKIYQIIISQSQKEDRREHLIEQLHSVNNAEMYQKSLVETVLQLPSILTEIIEEGVKKGMFKTKYPRESVEFLLVASQFLFDKGLFQWQPKEIAEKRRLSYRWSQ